ncbi:hypothetical protein F5Y12DRAFT_796971 [Xylaria sp. FL1777]|nr:hypothetical protein F5Y12DRAFT_796971 [Xylaria sp. FL1777]
MIEDHHEALHTLLFGELRYWKNVAPVDTHPEPFEDAKILLSYSFYKNNCIREGKPYFDYLANTPTEEWRKTLQNALQDQTWGFSDDNVYGITISEYNSVIILGARPIETLTRQDVTLAESCHLIYSIARTILHELMHAVIISRVKLTFAPEDPSKPWDIGTEPFVDFDLVSEMGYAMEHRMFGGICLNNHESNTYPMGMHYRNWPFVDQPDEISGFGYKIPMLNPYAGGSENVEAIITPVPALYTSSMLSRHFWEDSDIPRKSDNFFYRNILLLGRTPYNRNVDTIYQEITVDDTKISNGGVYTGDLELIQSWRYWESVWNYTRKGWYDKAKINWETSPWVEVDIFNQVFQFEKSFRSANEVYCAAVSESLARTIPWDTDAETYKTALLPNVQQKQNGWIWHSLGLLMMAAIPIRFREISKAPTSEMPTLQLFPSHRAPRIPPLNIAVPVDMSEEFHGKSVLYDPLTKGGEPLDRFDNLDYLNKVRGILKFLGAAGAHLSKPWLFEILRILEKLELQRGELKNEYPVLHIKKWAPEWDFRLPEYDPTEVVKWNEKKGEWETAHL